MLSHPSPSLSRSPRCCSDKQHVAFLAAMGGLYPCPEVIEPILAKDSTGSKAILDLGRISMFIRLLHLSCKFCSGSGTGTWAIEMAKRFPHAAVTGVDIAPNPLDPATFPSNISFVRFFPQYGSLFLPSSGNRRYQSWAQPLPWTVRLDTYEARPFGYCGYEKDDGRHRTLP